MPRKKVENPRPIPVTQPCSEALLNVVIEQWPLLKAAEAAGDRLAAANAEDAIWHAASQVAGGIVHDSRRFRANGPELEITIETRRPDYTPTPRGKTKKQLVPKRTMYLLFACLLPTLGCHSQPRQLYVVGPSERAEDEKPLVPKGKFRWDLTGSPRK